MSPVRCLAQQHDARPTDPLQQRIEVLGRAERPNEPRDHFGGGIHVRLTSISLHAYVLTVRGTVRGSRPSGPHPETTMVGMLPRLRRSRKVRPGTTPVAACPTRRARRADSLS